MNADCFVMLRRLSLAIADRKWRLAYAWADALDALIGRPAAPKHEHVNFGDLAYRVQPPISGGFESRPDSRQASPGQWSRLGGGGSTPSAIRDSLFRRLGIEPPPPDS